MTADRLVRIDGIRVAVLRMLTAHTLGSVVHQEVTLVMLLVLLVTARVRILTGAITQRCHNHVLNVVIYGKVYRRFLHLRLLLGAATGQADALLAIGLMRQD